MVTPGSWRRIRHTELLSTCPRPAVSRECAALQTGGPGPAYPSWSRCRHPLTESGLELWNEA